MIETITVPLPGRADAGVMNDMTVPDPEVPRLEAEDVRCVFT